MGYNDITGEAIRSKNIDPDARKRFEEGFDRIFCKKVPKEYVEDLLKTDKERKDFFEGKFE